MTLTARRSLTISAAVLLAVTSLSVGSASAADEDNGGGNQSSTSTADGHQHGTSTGGGNNSSSGTSTSTSGNDRGATSGNTANSRAQQIPAAPAPDGICQDSNLPPATGFQDGPVCVSLEMGELGAANDNPQLLITDAPAQVGVGEAFTLQVSSRNLVRDTFLPAAEGGYYVQPGELDGNGIIRGHFHTACRVLDSTGVAPQPEQQEVFVATEDGGGGAGADTVAVEIPGLPEAGEAQCATWAGDGSHRMPMMAFANQVPAFDAVRIQVGGDGGQANDQQANDQAAEQNNADQQAAEQNNTGQQNNADQQQDNDQAQQQNNAGQSEQAQQQTDTGEQTGQQNNTSNEFDQQNTDTFDTEEQDAALQGFDQAQDLTGSDQQDTGTLDD